KKPAEPVRREILCDRLRVETSPSLLQERIVEIRGEHLQLTHPRRLVCGLDEGHGDRIRLLAGGTAEGPDAKRLVTTLAKKRGPDLTLEHLKCVRVAKEAGHADEHI